MRICCLALLLATAAGQLAFPSAVPAAVDLQELVDRISPDSIGTSLARLVGFQTRFMASDSSAAAAQWLQRRLGDYGYENARLDSFELNVSKRISGQNFFIQGETEVNVLAEMRGRRPDRYVVIGGHFDSISLDRSPQDQDVAPGADDNATGVSAVLEIARVLAGLKLDATVMFAFWGAEELGLIGSSHFATRARARGDSIRVMFQLDSIGSRADDFPEAFTIETVARYASQAQRLADAAREFTPVRSRNSVGGDLYITTNGCNCSDHQSFINNGFPGIGVFQYYWNPAHHLNSSIDTLSRVDADLVADIARAVAVAAVRSAGEPSLTSDFNGDGRVDFDDFLLFANAFGLSAGEAGVARFDLDGNGRIGFSDFLLFVSDYGKSV